MYSISCFHFVMGFLLYHAWRQKIVTLFIRMLVGFSSTDSKISFSIHWVELVWHSILFGGYTKCNSKNFGILYTIVNIITGVTNQRVFLLQKKRKCFVMFHKVNIYCIHAQGYTLVWWQLWNFIVRQVNFNIFLHPNEPPQKGFQYLVGQLVANLSKIWHFQL